MSQITYKPFNVNGKDMIFYIKNVYIMKLEVPCVTLTVVQCHHGTIQTLICFF